MIDLIDYGLTPSLTAGAGDGIPARVTSVHKGCYELICRHGRAFGRLKAAPYHAGGEAFPAAGDFVMIDYLPGSDSRITKTLPRRSCFSRLDPSSSGNGGQTVAANFDYVFILQSLHQDFNPRRLERYLMLAWQSGAVPAVLLTKADLLEDPGAQLRQAEKLAGSAGVYAVSAKTGDGVEALADYLKPRKTVVLLGSSGAGKSSLVNTLCGEERMEEGGVRRGDGKGRHTTTRRQLVMLPGGAMLIDTPGLRELGMWDASGGMERSFADVEQYFGRCRFADCRHDREPGCAVRAAIERGELPLSRWESYWKLSRESRRTGAGKQRKDPEPAAPRRPEGADYRRDACPESFVCKVCGSPVAPEGAGTHHRNHCPKCLSSVHLDNEPGDRASLCRGVMDPIGVWVRKNGEWAIIHRCRACGALSSNRIAADDNPALLMSIAVKPLAAPPFPLARLGEGFGNEPNSQE